MSEETNKTIENESSNQTNNQAIVTEDTNKTENTNRSDDSKKSNNNSSVKSAFVNGLFKIVAIVVVALIVFFAATNLAHKQTIETTVSSVLKDNKTISELQTLKLLNCTQMWIK